MRGRAPLIGSDRSDQITEPIRGARPPTASHFRPPTASHGLSLSASHGLPRPLTFGLPRPPIALASHNLSCDLSEPIRGARPLTHTASQILDSQICEAVGVRSDSSGRGNAFSCEISQIAPRIGLSAGVRERPIGLSNL